MRRSATLLSVLVALVGLGAASYAGVRAVTVGTPEHPERLGQEIAAAVSAGNSTVKLRPSKYVMPGGRDGASLTLRDMHDVRILAAGVELAFTDLKDGVAFYHCENVEFTGATLHYSRPLFCQARILSFGTDPKQGAYYDVAIDAGYPFDADFKSSYVFDTVGRRIRFATWDMGAKSVVKGDAANHVRVFWGDASLLPPRYQVAVNDYLVCRGGGSSLLHADGCKRCAFRNLSLYWGGIFGIFETGRSVANRYDGIRIMRGPIPPGASAAPVVSQSADGFHSTGALVGPDIENCDFESMCDDAIAIHGSFVNVIESAGRQVTLKEDWANDHFRPGDTARISDDKGLFREAKVVSVSKMPDGKAQLTLDSPAPPVGSKLSNPAADGAGYRILHNIIRNNRARGILAKGDGGLIEQNVIEGCTMSAISIGPEYWWNEADYCKDVRIRNNVLREVNYATNGFGHNGAVFVHGDGARGNRNIKITGNRIEGVYGPNVILEWADGVNVEGNVFVRPAGRSVGEDAAAGALLWMRHCTDVRIAGNKLSRPGPAMKVRILAVDDVIDLKSDW